MIDINILDKIIVII